MDVAFKSATGIAELNTLTIHHEHCLQMHPSTVGDPQGRGLSSQALSDKVLFPEKCCHRRQDSPGSQLRPGEPLELPILFAGTPFAIPCADGAGYSSQNHLRSHGDPA
jgi:hypothetical protein